MKKVDVTTPEGKLLWESYIDFTKALADVVRDGPYSDNGLIDKPIVVTIKIWPQTELSFQLEITEEGKFHLRSFELPRDF